MNPYMLVHRSIKKWNPGGGYFSHFILNVEREADIKNENSHLKFMPKKPVTVTLADAEHPNELNWKQDIVQLWSNSLGGVDDGAQHPLACTKLTFRVCTQIITHAPTFLLFPSLVWRFLFDRHQNILL